jgi:hypothetical protein
MKPIHRPFHPCLLTCIRRPGAHTVNPAARHGLRAASGMVLMLAALGSDRAAALDRTWIGGNVDWIDNGLAANWSPADEPDTDDTAIFNTANTVNLGSNNSVNGLTLSGGISLITNDFDLTVDGLVQLIGSGTDLSIGGSASLLTADSVAINADASVLMTGGAITVIEETGFGTLNINSGGTLRGNGVINFNDGVAAGTTLMTLSGGVLTATSFDLLGTNSSTLTINVNDVDGRIDLDNGVSPTVNVGRNDTLDINGTSHDASDPFNGTLNLGDGSTIDMSVAWESAGTINANTNGVILGSAGPAATIAGAALTVSGGSINLDAIDSLRFSAPLTTTAGTIANAGLIIFDAATTVGAGTDFQMTGSEASLTVGAGAVVNIDDINFNADGGGTATNVITINSGGILDLDLGVGGETGIGSTINLNGGQLDVTTDPNTWSIDRSVTVGASTGTSQINGEALTINGAAITLGSSSTLDVAAQSTWPTGSAAAVGSAASLRLQSSATLSGASFTGAGTLFFGSSSTTSATTTIATGTLDWDGLGIGSLHTINPGMGLTITSPVITGSGMSDPISLGGAGGSLTVSGPATWNMRNTLTTNPAATGTATVAGTSRMVLDTATGILNANGNTTISAPVTFGASSVTNVAAAADLTVTGNAIYDGGLITGAGNYNPPTGGNNTVSASSTISTTSFDSDLGSWLVEAGATLTVNVSDYDNTVTNAFDNSITIQSGTVSMTTGDPEFVMNTGTLTLSNTTGTSAIWTGEPLHIGSDTGALDANLNVSGTGLSQISSAVTFQSDADVNVPAGTTLLLASTATFNSVNGVNNAEFTGSGTLVTGSTVNFNEATTLNFAGGSVDLDGIVGDTTFNTVNVDAPVILNAATIDSFGNNNIGGFANTIDINSLAGTGLLTVNLDNPASEWTLNSLGVMNLTNDNAAATLLAGNDLNLNGTLNVTGDARTDARLDIGAAATLNLLTAGEPFRLSGGDLVTTNTLNGGTLNGPGLLGADGGSALTGFGTIAANADIDFDGSSDLLADNGTLTINSTIVDVRNIGTADADGTLNVPNAWTPPTGSTVLMQGGLLQGGIVTLDNANGMVGQGDVSAQIINNTLIHANVLGKTLKLTNTLNDWDGTDAPEDGILRASNGGTLECIDNATFNFEGTLNAFSNGTVASNGFAFTLAPASTLSLGSGGSYRSTNSTDIQGAVTVGAGADSTIDIEINRFLDFEATSSTTLTGNLRLVTNNGIIRAGATFGGAGALKIAAGSFVGADNTANINALLENAGDFHVGGLLATGRTDVKDYQQTASGDLRIDLRGTALADHDRLFVNGTAQIDGDLELFLGGGYVPALNDTFNVVSATGGVTGTFDSLVQPAGMPAGLVFDVTYSPTFVQLKVIAGSPFDTWINSFGSLTDPADKTKEANPDGDDLNNLGEFALDGDPTSGVSSGKIVGKIAPVGGVNVMTLTLPVRSGAMPDVGDPAGGELVLKQVIDQLTYRIQATDDLAAFTLDVSEVSAPDATAIQAGLPPLNGGWVYRTFRSPGPVAGDPVEFMRAVISE